MAQCFKTASLVLSRQTVTCSGSLLYVNGLLVGSGIYAPLNALQETGSILYNLVTGASGQAAVDYATKVQLTQSGVIIEGQINSLSGWASNLIATTGQQAWTAADNNGINLSGNLTATGATLQGRINSLSGFVNNVSGALQILITNSDADVSSINGQSGALTIAGTGGLTVSSGALGLILVSGDQSISGALTATGVTLGAKIDSLSGFVGNVSGGLEARVTATGNAAVVHANGIGVNLSGNLAQTGSNLYVTLTGTSGQGVIDYATKTALTSTGQTLFNLIIGGDTNLSGNLTQTGITLRNLTLGGDTNLSGQLTTTGQMLYSLITNGSGQSNVNYAPALANYVYQSGVQLVTGIKAFLSELRFNSGLKTPVQFFGPANYTLASGNFMVIATGTTASTTGILPSATDYSGVMFNLINGGAISLQISGVIGPDTNPVLAPWDAAEIYATSGQWWYMRQTGSPLLAMIVGGDTNLSGNLTLTGQTLRALTLGGDTNLSGNLTTTGQTLYQAMTGLSGQANTNYATVTNLALTGSNLYVTLTGVSGQAVIDYATKIALTSTGQTLFNLTIGGDTNLSGRLTATGALLSAVQVTGSSIINVVNLSGLGGTLVIQSGSYVLVSGAAGGGGVSQGQLDSLSGYSEGIYVHRSGNESISGVKTFGSGIFTGAVGINTATPLNPLDVNAIARFQQNLRFTATNQSGSFTLAAGTYRYIWSGAANQTGTLPAASATSGIEFMVKNLSATGSLVISGLVDYYQNYVLSPLQGVTLWSDNTSWLLV